MIVLSLNQHAFRNNLLIKLLWEKYERIYLDNFKKLKNDDNFLVIQRFNFNIFTLFCISD